MIRRNAPMKRSAGTVIPATVRLEVLARDGMCVGENLGWPGPHHTALELDHVRAGGMGMKSASTPDNLVSLCSECHRRKTENGRALRPVLLAYLESVNARI